MILISGVVIWIAGGTGDEEALASTAKNYGL